MTTKNVIFIDGIKTRQAIDEMVGKKEGATKLCIEKGISNGTINRICRDGYGTPEAVKRYKDAGFPIIESNRPVPCRLRREHKRSKVGKIPAGEQIDLGTIYPKQFETIKNTEAKIMRDIIIKHLTALITELKEI